MDRKELEAKVCELVAISYKQDPSAVTVETSFKDDLKGASVQMVSACETVGDLVDLVEEEM